MNACSLPLLALLVGCTASSSRVDNTTSNAQPDETATRTLMPSSTPDASTQLVPRWRVGDRWVVRYKAKLDMGRAQKDNELVMWEYEWQYRVTSIEDAGIHVVADIRVPYVRENEATMFFTPEGRLISATHDEIEERELGAALYFPLYPKRYLPVAFEWPAFPLTEASDRPMPPGFVEKVEHTGNSWRVTVRRRGDSEFDPGWKRENTMEQIWEPDRPWWTSITIRSRVEGPGEVTEDVDVEGRVTEWHLGE
jgi:hypothetical protein